METKQCNKCGEVKEITDFYKMVKGSFNNRRQSYCKKCHLQYQKDNREKINENNKKILWKRRLKYSKNKQLLKEFKSDTIITTPMDIYYEWLKQGKK